jgi:DNA polymerase-1
MKAATKTLFPAALFPAEAADDSTPASADLRGKTVFVVDVLSRVYQLFHALPEMTSPQGTPVSAVFGFARDLLDVLEKRRPDYVFCALDAPGPTFRHEQFADYKATRAAMPEDLVPQIDLVRRLVAVMRIPLLEVAGYEADDVLATIATISASAGAECTLATSDKDARQLLGPHVKLLNLRTGEPFGEAELLAEWGIRPGQVVDFLALVGDAVDNVPGVPLIGPKIASELLGRFGTLDEVLAHADEVSGKKRAENLRTHGSTALAGRRLVELHREVPVTIPWKAAHRPSPDAPGLVEFFREMGFKSLLEKAKVIAASQAGPGEPAAASAGADAEVPTAGHAAPRFDTIADDAALAALAESIRLAGTVTIGAAKPSSAGLMDPPVGIATHDEAGVHFVPAPLCVEDAGPGARRFRELLADPAVVVRGHDLKRQAVWLRAIGIELDGLGFDTLVAAYLLDAGERNHTLVEIAARHAGLPEGGGDAAAVERPADAPAAATAVSLAAAVAGGLEAGLEAAGLAKLFREVEMPLVAVLAGMEWEGVRIDVPLLDRLSGRYAERIATLEQEIHGLAGHPFAIASPVQVRKVLFDELGLPVVKRTKTGPSTDAEVLEELAPLHPLPAKLLEHRQYAKLKSTYVDALPKLVEPTSGRIHTSFNQTVTGRLSSSDPNLQNIPIRTREGREIRAAFLPRRDDWRFVSADYSQIELRILAHLSHDAAMKEAFAKGEDIHTRTAIAVFSATADEVTPEMRRIAKAVNFGILYGQSGFGLAKALSITPLEAAAFRTNYFRTFAGAAAFMDDLLDRCLADGHVTTILGRRRSIAGVRPRERRRDASGTFSLTLPERTAINTAVQGSAADLIKLAMLRVERAVRAAGSPARLVLQIHDELVLESPEADVPQISRIVADEMRSAMQLDVPLEVSVSHGRTWDDCGDPA